jgi:nitrogen fixation protein NifU and related proteins
MAELRDLYQETILEHARSPRNYKALPCAMCKAEGFNPLCGDRCTVYVDVQDGVIKDVAFEGSGCAISKASASMMTQTLKGKTPDEAEAMFDAFHRMVTGQEEEQKAKPAMGKLEAFAGVSEFPARVKCATLPWHTLQAAMHGGNEHTTTE